MKLGQKKNVKKKFNNEEYPSLLNRINIFKKENSFIVKPKHKVKKFKTTSSKNFHKDTFSKESKDFGIKPILTQKKPTYKNSITAKQSYVIAIISFILTSSTIFYFYEVSTKTVMKKESVIDLYKKYESIKHMNQKSSLILNSLSSPELREGHMLVMVDSTGTVDKLARQAIKKYEQKQQNPELFGRTFYVLLLATGFLIFCIFARIYLLIREKEGLLLQEQF